MLKAMLRLSLFVFLTRAFEIDPDEYLVDEYVIEDLKETLKDDPFFGDMKEVKSLGTGGYGVVLEMEKPGSGSVAVKISNEQVVDNLPPVIGEELLAADNALISNRVANLRFINYLQNRGVPFLPNSITDRNVVLFNPIDKTIEIKNLWAQELAGFGDLKQFCVKRRAELKGEKRVNFMINIMYKVLYAMDKVLKAGIMHGDIKPQNIFLKKCNEAADEYNVNEQFDEICPVIGDWDLGYYYDGFKEDFMAYTIEYRPPEMLFFNAEYNKKDRNRMFIHNGGYVYSRKEDVFALGATFVNALRSLGINLKELEKSRPHLAKLLEEMVYPIPLNDVHSYTNPNMFLLDLSSDKILGNIFKKENLDTSMLGNFNKIKGYLDKIAKELKASNVCLVDEYNEEAKTKLHNPGVLYYRIKGCLKDKGSALKLSSILNASELSEFKRLDEKLSSGDLLKDVVSGRKSMNLALNEIEKIYLELHGKEKHELEEDKYQLGSQNTANYISTGDRSVVYLAPSFLRLSHDLKSNFCQIHYNKNTEYVFPEANNGDIESGTIEELCAPQISDHSANSKDGQLNHDGPKGDLDWKGRIQYAEQRDGDSDFSDLNKAFIRDEQDPSDLDDTLNEEDKLEMIKSGALSPNDGLAGKAIDLGKQEPSHKFSPDQHYSSGELYHNGSYHKKSSQPANEAKRLNPEIKKLTPKYPQAQLDDSISSGNISPDPRAPKLMLNLYRNAKAAHEGEGNTNQEHGILSDRSALNKGFILNEDSYSPAKVTLQPTNSGFRNPDSSIQMKLGGAVPKPIKQRERAFAVYKPQYIII